MEGRRRRAESGVAQRRAAADPRTGVVVMDADAELEAQIGHWRGYVQRHGVISTSSVDEMEDHLREQVCELSAARPDGRGSVPRRGQADGERGCDLAGVRARAFRTALEATDADAGRRTRYRRATAASNWPSSSRWPRSRHSP